MQSRIFFPTVLIFYILLSPLAYGQGYTDPDDPYPTLSYKKTLELCSIKFDDEDKPTFNWDMWTFIKYGAVASIKLIDPDSAQLSKPVKDILNSRGYKMALDECYGPADSSQWAYIEHKAFTVALISADFGGHIVGFLSWMIPIDAFGRMFTASQFALANPGLMRAGAWTLSAANRLALAAVAGFGAWDTYKNYQLRVHAKEYFEEASNRMVNTTRAEMDATYVMVEKKLISVNAELAKGVSDPQRRQYLLDKKAQLEERLKTRNQAPPQLP